MKTYHILISGKVQGVGFRKFTTQCANSLNLKGWVRNLKSGQVEVLIQGVEAEMDLFLNQIKRGPQRSSVSDFYVEEIKNETALFIFEWKPDGEYSMSFNPTESK